MQKSMEGSRVVGRTVGRRALGLVVAGVLSTLGGSSARADGLTIDQIFKRPVLSRAYEQDQWVLRTADKTGLREDAQSVGVALSRLRPSYVSGLIYLRNGSSITNAMIQDYATMRSLVLARDPDAKFDVEVSLNPNPPANGGQPFASPAALLAFMAQVNAQLHPDAWWFDFYSDADKDHPDWISAAISYAHARGQTVGGNVFGNKVPPGSDAVAFVDKPVAGSTFGFDFDENEVAKLRTSSPSTVLMGHLQSNPQNGAATESCVYIQEWTIDQRFSYLRYWASQQKNLDFRFMYPVFYPLCPGAYAYDPLEDQGPEGHTLYQRLLRLIDASDR